MKSIVKPETLKWSGSILSWNGFYASQIRGRMRVSDLIWGMRCRHQTLYCLRRFTDSVRVAGYCRRHGAVTEAWHVMADVMSHHNTLSRMSGIGRHRPNWWLIIDFRFICRNKETKTTSIHTFRTSITTLFTAEALHCYIWGHKCHNHMTHVKLLPCSQSSDHLPSTAPRFAVDSCGLL